MAETYTLAASTQLSPYMTKWEWFRLGWKQQMVQWKKQSLVFINLSHLLSGHIEALSNSQCSVPLAAKAMAKKVLSLPFLPLLLLLFFFTSGGILKLANGQEMKTWCVAKPSSSEAELAANIHFACDQIQDCSIIQEGGPCYYPNTAINHASVVMNIYYQLSGRHNWNCDFRASGLITLSNPSYGGCQYA